MFEWKQKASNAILLDDNVGGKGKCFRAKFLQPGLVKYSFGVCLLDKMTIDRFVYQFEGCPVIIDHKDVTTESAKDDRVGVISKVWFNECDSWYWCEGVIFDQEALDLIDKGFNVSCQYEITEYSENRENKLHNGNEYDKTILNGRPEHLAIVQNPRYENAMIAVNALNKSEEQPRDEKGRWTNKTGNEYYDEILKENSEIINMSPEEYINECSISMGIDKDELISSRQDESLEKIKKSWDEGAIFNIPYLHYKEENFMQDGLHRAIVAQEKNEKNIPVLKIVENKIVKNNIIEAINEIKETDMFKNLFGKKEKKMEKEEIKAIFLECLTELKASNEAEEKKEEDAKNEEDVKEKEEEKEAENKCKNAEEPDYKKLYEELKAKMEAANEEKEEKEDKEKAKNSIDEQMAMFCKEIETGKSDYVSKAKAIELGSELF